MPQVLQYKFHQDHSPFDRRIEKLIFDDILLIVPTRRKARHLSRELVSLAGSNALPALQLFTLEVLATRIFSVLHPSVRIIRESHQSLLFSKSIQMAKDNLEYFAMRGKRKQLRRGTFDKIVEVVKNLKEHGVYPDDLAEEIGQGEPEEQQKLIDIISIYRGYELQLERFGGIDHEGIFKVLSFDVSLERFKSSFRALFPKVATVSIEGFDEFTGPEMGFLEKVCSISGVGVSLSFDFLPGNRQLFGHLEDNVSRFKELGFTSLSSGAAKGDLLSNLQVDKSERVSSIVGLISKHLFAGSAELSRMDISDKVTIISGIDRTREVEAICKKIKQIALKEPTRDISRICVAMHRPQPYTDLFREAFKRFGIPANITDRFPLSRSSLVISIVGMLQIPMLGFRRNDIFRTLESPYLRFKSNKGEIDTGNLTNIANQLRITAGKSGWVGRIGKEIEIVQKGLAGSPGDQESRDYRAELSSLERAKSDFQHLVEMLDPISKENSPSQFRAALVELLQEVELIQAVVVPTSMHFSDLVEKDSRAYTKFLQVLDETVELLEYQDGKDQKHPLRYYYDHLKIALSRERYNIREKAGHGVLVTAIEETRGLDLDVMFVAGLVDGEFPAPYQPEIFLSTNRQIIREQRHKWENRYLFYQAITNWSEHLYLTYPAKEGDLELVRSSFVDAIERLGDVCKLSYPGIEELNGVAYSDEEVYKYFGRNQNFISTELEQLDAGIQARLGLISKAIDVEKSRTETHVMPEYEGRIGECVSESSRIHLDNQRGRTYSVSQLEEYGKCPFKFFAQRMLRLNTPGDLSEELSPLERGSVLHEVMFEFYTDRRERRLPKLSDCSDEEFDSAVDNLIAIAKEKLSTLDIPDSFWELEKRMMLGEKGIDDGLLKKFLEFERQRDLSIDPKFFEVRFGMGVGKSEESDQILYTNEPQQFGNIKLRGKVDRIEVGENCFTIIDYKTGKLVPSLSKMEQGESLQLPLYLYIIERMLSEHLNQQLRPVAGLYYQLRNPIALKLGVGERDAKGSAFETSSNSRNLLPPDKTMHDIIHMAEDLVNSFVENIAKGEFPLRPTEKGTDVCGYCDFKTICRIQTVKGIESNSEGEE